MSPTSDRPRLLDLVQPV